MDPVTLAALAAGAGAVGSIGGALIGANAQQDAINQAGAQQAAALRQQIGLSEQQMELARPLLNVRDGVLGVLAQRFGIAPPRPALTRSAQDGTALVPVPGVTFKDNASGSPDARTNVFFDPVNQNFTTQTGAVIAPASEGIIPGLTQGKNNTVEIRNGQIRGLGNSGSVDVMALPAQVAAPSAQQPAGVGEGMTSGGQYTDAQGNVMGGGAPVGPQSLTLQDFIGPQQNVTGLDPASMSRGGEDLFRTARGLIGEGNASGITNSDVAALVNELRGMTGQDQLDFERAEAERGLSRLANSRGLRNSGRELMALRERDVNVVGQRQDQRIRNALQVAGLAANRADTGFAQTQSLANLLGLRDDVGFGQGAQMANFAAQREDQGFNRALMENQSANANRLTESQFGANRADQEIANLFTLAGLGSSGTNVAFNAGANLGNAYGNMGNNMAQLSLAGGANQAGMYNSIGQSVGNSLFDFALLNQYMNNGNRNPSGLANPIG